MKNKLRILAVLAALVALLASLGACTSSVAYSSLDVPGHFKMNFSYLNGTKTEGIKAKEGQTIVLDYSSKVTKGKLVIQVTDPDDKVVAGIEAGSEGTREIRADKDGKYHLVIEGSKARGKYDFRWKVR